MKQKQQFMPEQHQHLINTKKYWLSIRYTVEQDQMKISFYSKINNSSPIICQLNVPDELKEDGMKFYRKIRRYRSLIINPLKPSITLLPQEKELLFKNPIQELIEQIKEYSKVKTEQAEGEEQKQQKQKEIEEKKNSLIAIYQEHDRKVNSGIKYWEKEFNGLQLKAILNPHYKQILFSILQKNPLMTASATISLSSLKNMSFSLQSNYKAKDLLSTLFKSIIQTPSFSVAWENKKLNISHQLKEIPVHTFKPHHQNLQEGDNMCSEKAQLFKHIFLIQILAQMIVSQFGKLKVKQYQQRNGYQQYQFLDQELQELRSWGYRFSQLKDHPFKQRKSKTKKRKIKKEDQSSEEQEQKKKKQEWRMKKEQEKNKQKGQQSKNKKWAKKDGEKQMTELEKIGRKIKRMEEICNLTLITGEQKSQINQMRYSLHQMSRETDKTEAMINFIQLAFHVFPKEELMNRWTREIQLRKKMKMKHFVREVRAKRQLLPILIEYTKDSFFHKILNTGLRVLKTPQELIYLRFVFSHMFWSIKLLYHRHKRVIFQDTKQSAHIQLYRGCSLLEEEIQMINQNIGGYLQAEGFLSTSLEREKGVAFAKNVLIVIQIKFTNMKGIFDNGFAELSTFSDHSTEKEVLVNAFNVFKIVGFKQAQIDEKAHTIFFDYGSKIVEDKMKKSDHLLEAEYNYKVNCQELKNVKEVLEEKKKDLTEDFLKNMMEVKIPWAEEKLRKRKEFLEEWKEEEYQHALQQLSQWEKQLIRNTKHSQKERTNIENFGELLFAVGQYKRASQYCRRKLKQVELDRTVEGLHWRNSPCIIYKQIRLRSILWQCDIRRVRAEGIGNLQKLGDLLISQSSTQQDYQCVGRIYTYSLLLVGKGEDKKKITQKLTSILKQYSLENTPTYKEFMKLQKICKGGKTEQEKDEEKEEKEKKNERMKEISKIKQKLQQIVLFTHGKYTNQYLRELFFLIWKLQRWEYQEEMLKEGKNYLKVRSSAPHAEDRKLTCSVLKWALHSCSKKRKKEQFTFVCQQLASFIRSPLCKSEFSVIYLCLLSCGEKQWWRAGKTVVQQIMKGKLYCEVDEDQVNNLLRLSYVLLLLTITKEDVVREFLGWAGSVCGHKEIQYIVEYNAEYEKSRKSLYWERMKDYEDGEVIQCVREHLGAAPPQTYTQKEEIIPFQRPFHFLLANVLSLYGIDTLMQRGKVTMLFQYFQQYTNMHSHIMGEQFTTFYLRMVRCGSKVHLSEDNINTLPALLSFYSSIKELFLLQTEQMNIDLRKVIHSTEHLNEKRKQVAMQALDEMRWMGRKEMAIGKVEGKMMRGIYNKFRYYQQHHPFGIRRFKHKHKKFRSEEDWKMVLSIKKATEL